MTTKYISKKTSLFLAEQFAESFYEPEPTSIGYVFVGKHNNYTSEPTPEEIDENTKSEFQIWKNIIAAKKISGNDINLVLPLKEWRSGIVYEQYDDDALYTSANNFYVMAEPSNDNSVYRVYKCLSNGFNLSTGLGTESSLKPEGSFTINNGIITPGDGYIWKYMFTVTKSSKFSTLNYVPVPLNTLGSNESTYNMSADSIIDGAIYSIKIQNAGSGYGNTTVAPVSTASATNILTLSTTTGVVAGMFVKGNNIVSGTYIESVGAPLSSNQIRLSQNTSAAILSSGNDLTFSTRMVILGDGTGAQINNFTLNQSGAITSVSLTPYGTNYTYANTQVFGKGTGAILRPIIGPKFGHGLFPARELGANSALISVNFGKGDATEGGRLSTPSTYRQIGFLRDPHKYGFKTPLNSITSNNIISQIYTATVVPGTSYPLNSIVYQGTDSSTNFNFRGRVYSQTESLVKLTQVEGNFIVGEPLKFENSISRIGLNIQYPDLQPFTGDILYVENISTINRTASQSENIRFVINF